MAPKAKAKNPAKFTRGQLKDIWKALKDDEWLRLPNSGALSFRKNKPGDILGLCPHPDHTDTAPSFHIYTEQHHGYCYGCGYRPTDPVELVSYICELSYAQSIVLIQNTCPSAHKIQGAHFRTFVEQQQIAQEVKNVFNDVCHEQLILAVQAYAENLKLQANPKNIIQEDVEDLADCDFSALGDESDYPEELLEKDLDVGEKEAGVTPDNVVPITAAKNGIGMCDFDYATKTVHWLVTVRKIPLDILPLLPIGIVPPTSIAPTLARKVIAANSDLTEYTEQLIRELQLFLSADVNRNVVGVGTGGVIFPLCTSDSNITSFRIRQPNEPGESKRISLLQDAYEDTLGFFGLNFPPYVAFQRKNKTQKQKSYVVVEGEFDALQAMVRAIQTGEVKYPVISAGGNSALASFTPIVVLNDIQNLYLMGDSPEKGETDTGTKVVSLWIKNIKDCNISIFSNDAWDKLEGADDLDHAYTQTTIPPEKIDAALGDIQNYIPAWRWVYDQTIPLLQEYTEDNVAALYTIIEYEGRNLLRDTDINAYIQAICDSYPILNSGRLKRGIVSSGDTEKAFICRVANALTDTHSVIGVMSSPLRGKELCLFCRKDERFAHIKIDSEGSIVQEIAQIAGTLSNFYEETVGLPSFLSFDPVDEVDDNGNRKKAMVLPLQAMDKRCRFYAREAVATLTEGAPNMDNLTKIRNGYHNIQGKEILVHGTESFILNRDTEKLTFTKTTNPRIGNILVDVYDDEEHKLRWFKDGSLSTELLQEAQNGDLRQTFIDLCRFFDAGFVFEQQEVTCQFLAALALTIPIMSCFDRQIVTHFTGETSSGKTTLLTVFGGQQNKNALDIQIVYTSRLFLNITPAAFTRTAANTTLLHCIDELEFDTDKNKATNESIMQALRGIQTGGGSKTITDMSNGGTVTQRYNVPVIFASITGTDKPQDLNRTLRVSMKKRRGQIDPNTAIHKKFSPKELHSLRLVTNFGLYSHIPKIKESYAKIQTMYAEINEKLPYTVESRFLASFYPLFAIMETIGVDYLEFMRKYVECNKNQIARDTQINDCDVYLDKIFNNSVIKLQNYKETYQCQSLARILTSRISRQELNDSGVGVFYDDSQNLILLNLEQVIMHLVPSQLRASASLSAYQLRTILDRHSASLSDAEILESGILKRAAIPLGVGIQVHNVSVLRAAYWLGDNRSNAVTTPTTPPTDETKQEETQDEPTNIVSDWCC